MTIKIHSVIDAVTGLTYTGINCKNFDKIPLGMVEKSLPLFFPDPENILTEPEFTPVTYGTTNRAWDGHYTLNFLLVNSVVGTGRTDKITQIAEAYDNAFAICDKLMATEPLNGAVEFIPGVDKAITLDYSGMKFIAIPVTVKVTEIVQ